MKETLFSIVVFAHNSENKIQSCLEGILKQEMNDDELIHVVVNESTDATTCIVLRMVTLYQNIKLVILNEADRANAWNHYVYNLATQKYNHIFIDSDVIDSKNSFSTIRSTITHIPYPLAFSTFPINGLRCKKWIHKILVEKAMFGNFYCLRSNTVERIKDISFKIPRGYFCDDAFTTWALLRNFHQQDHEDRNPIYPVIDCGYYHEPLEILSLNGFRLHLKRQYRFAVRNIQTNLLIDRDMSEGYHSIPKYINEFHDCAAIIKTAKIYLKRLLKHSVSYCCIYVMYKIDIFLCNRN